MSNYFRCILVGAAVFTGFFPVCGFAHDTNTIHVQITGAAIEVLKKKDESDLKYQELYEKDGANFVYWGESPELGEQAAVNDEKNEYSTFVHQKKNVVDGVVQEDHPNGRVLTHFYHAYSGVPLQIVGLNLPLANPYKSRQQAIRYFDQAVEVFGYRNESDKSPNSSKRFGFWLFGHSLHHLEDMSSVAHVNNDAHLTVLAEALQERDDFEANFLPSAFWTDTWGVKNFFKVDTYTSKTIPDIGSFDDIWSPPLPNSTALETDGDNLEVGTLARSTYNHSVFQGEIEFTSDIVVPVSLTLSYHYHTLPQKPCGDGELAYMMNTESAMQDQGVNYNTWPSGCRLHFYEADTVNYASWVIEEMTDSISPKPGHYFYQGQSFFADLIEAWWAADDPYHKGPSGYFYLEELMRGVGRGTGINKYGTVKFEPFAYGDLLVPLKKRSDFSKKWDTQTNPLVDNTANEPLVNLMAQKLLPMGVLYSAGYAKWFYDVANSPPYVKSLRVYQDSVEVYSGEWQDQFAHREFLLEDEEFLADAIPTGDETHFFEYVRSRGLAVEPALTFINDKSPICVLIEFSEPVRKPGDPDHGFSIGIDGQVLADSLWSLAPDDCKGGTISDDRSMAVSIQVAAFAGLNGKLPIAIKARDKNNHWNADGSSTGEELDENPGTPARRQRIAAGQARPDLMTEVADFPWHTKTSVDYYYQTASYLPTWEKYEMKPGDFAYDQDGDGDQTHILLFDTTKPEVTKSSGVVTDPPQ